MANKKEKAKNLRQNVKDLLQSIGVDLQQEVSLCLSDIPRESMSKSSNGKIYVNLCVAVRKEPDQWGRDLKVWVRQSQEERESGKEKKFVGSGKTIIFAKEIGNAPVSEDDLKNLPFIPDENNHAKDDLPF